MSAQLWQTTGQRPADWVPLGQTQAFIAREDFVRGELRPNTSIRFNGAPLSVNSLGMRDIERTLDKPPGVVRVALLGPSLVMGSGVADHETLSRLIEQRLNQRAGDAVRYEVLNFGIAAYALTQQLAILEERVFRFRPDVVMFTDSPHFMQPMVQHLLHALSARWPVPNPALQALLGDLGVTAMAREGTPVLFDAGRAALAMAGVPTRMPWVEADRRLRVAGDRLTQTVLEEMSRSVKAAGAMPVFLALSSVDEPPRAPVPVLAQAASAGMTVLDLFGFWQGRDLDALRLASWDKHPNAAGNALIADHVAEQLLQRAEALKLPIKAR